MIVNHAWAHDPANAHEVGVLGVAADKAGAAIRVATNTPSDWTGDSTALGTVNYVVLAQSAPTSQQLIAQLKPATPATTPAVATATPPVTLAAVAAPAVPAPALAS